MKNSVWKKFKKWIWDDAHYPKDKLLVYLLPLLTVVGMVVSFLVGLLRG